MPSNNQLNQKFTAIIPAGGIGSRMNSDKPKQFLEIAGKAIIIITLEQLLATDLFSKVFIASIDIDYCQEIINKNLSQYSKIIELCDAGKSRQDSVFKALNYAKEKNSLENFTLVHDAVRALIEPETIISVCQKAIETEAAIAARPISDTLKISKENNLIDKTIPRDSIWSAQTPQVFRTEIMLEAFQKAQDDGFEGTDCASLIERLGYPVSLVESPSTNIKITNQKDLELAKLIINASLRAKRSIW